jgi:AcrR family transcriptional regulator
MVTPKKKVKVRDAERTKQLLLNAVSEIIRTDGYAGLKVMKIVRHVNMDKAVIRYHFNGLVNLQKLYIAEKDYWPPFFERFKLSGEAADEEIKRMFTEMMQENFRFFRDNPEMQKIILWQISEENPLMRSVSDAREAEGAKLLALADDHFRNTGVDFKAVMGLLLGGIYYMVLHAQSNKSTVCGIDINLERDRETFLKTIGQVIDWAWNCALENNKTNENAEKMKYELDGVESRSEELAKGNREVPDKDLPDELLKLETKRLEKAMLQQLMSMTNETQISTYLNIHLHKLVEICDRLYDPLRASNPDAVTILNLLEAVGKPMKCYIPNEIALPLVFSGSEVRKFEEQWKNIKNALLQKGIDSRLIEIISWPFARFAKFQAKMHWADWLYLKRYAESMDNVINDPEMDLQWLLCRLLALDFNYTRFTAWYTASFKSGLEGKSRDEKRRLLEMFLRSVCQSVRLVSQSFDRKKVNIMEELSKWINLELNDLNNEKVEPGSNPMKINRLQTVLELAYWEKLQYDHGLVDETSLDVLSEKIAYNYSTKGQADLSAPSIKSKFYTKDLTVIGKAEKLLEKMLDDVRQYKN